MTSAKERRQNRVMEDLVRNSDAYFRKHPDIAKAGGIDLDEQQKKRDEWQIKHYGTSTYDRDSRYAPYEKVRAVPLEIEVSSALDNFVKMEILEELGISYSEWVERCYKERMKQIVGDPA